MNIHLSFRTVSPACAGNTGGSIRKCRHTWDHPRMRGEYFSVAKYRGFVEGSPPHARGIRRPSVPAPEMRGITPACAGNTPNLKAGDFPERDHPRMRGEYIMFAHNLGCQWGSPPHARGIPAATAFISLCSGITPACAGNTLFTFSSLSSLRDHPRMRGEYVSTCARYSVEPGSPPHARGIHVWRNQRADLPGITPACAGNTFSS